ncbi:MAG: sensor histidine kinase [Bifidobacteriaceae bacterium]|nr:sensor histidine kinase [Bifidobacteriaceae bacterium]
MSVSTGPSVAALKKVLREAWIPAVFAALVCAGPALEPDTALSPAVVGFALAGLAALSAQYRWPYPGVAVMVAGTLLAHSWGGAATPYLVSMGLAVYRLATSCARKATWLTGAAVAVVYLGAAACGIAAPGSWGDLVWAGMMLAIGDASRSRREALAASQERAARAEQTRALVAAKAVADERLRIARDVHDSIGHRMTVIAVHSAVAERLAEADPDASRLALGNVREASVTVLDELADLVNALRESGEGSELGPPVGIDGIGGLVDSFGRTGMRVDTRVQGPARPLAAAASQAAYRIVQESLTNAAKHGGAREADVDLRYGPAGLVIRVSNPLDPDGLAEPTGGRRVPETGHNGIVGMAERAHSAGGSLTAGPVDGAFAVTAVLPYLPGATR